MPFLVIRNYKASANINQFAITSSKNEKLLGISIDTRLSFENHITSLCKKASQKLHAQEQVIIWTSKYEDPVLKHL